VIPAVFANPFVEGQPEQEALSSITAADRGLCMDSEFTARLRALMAEWKTLGFYVMLSSNSNGTWTARAYSLEGFRRDIEVTADSEHGAIDALAHALHNRGENGAGKGH
jgi:hypothetical protein